MVLGKAEIRSVISKISAIFIIEGLKTNTATIVAVGVTSRFCW
jgi:hypothetical protein